MPYAYPEIRTFKGLFLQRNSFTTPDGALEVANNVNVTKDGLITSRRGYYGWFTPGTGTLNRAFNFNEVLVAAFGTKASYFTESGSSPNEIGTETVLSGSTVAVSTVGTSRSVQANGNLYFTSDNGPIKLPAYNGTLVGSGAPQALDITLRYPVGSNATWLTVGNMVGYRLVFGYTDVNGNLIVGAPSDIATISNTTVNGTWVRASNVITITAASHGLTTGQYIYVASSAPGGTTAIPEGSYQVTVTGTNTFTFAQTATDDASGAAMTYGYGAPVRLEASIPSEITTSLTWFYQIFRSSQQTTTNGIFDDFELIQQTNLTTAQITAGLFFFNDSVDDSLRDFNLYTNENSAEGEAQANYRPPMCLDMTFYKNYVLYANCTTRQILYINLVDSTVISATDYVELKISSTTRRYVARAGVGNRTVTGTCSSSTGLLITYTSHGFSNGDYIYVANQLGGSVANGFYYVVSKAADTFKISLTNGGAAVAYNSETSLDFEGVTDGTYPLWYFDTASSPATRIANTSRALVKAINRDSASLVYANYISGVNGIPGQMQLQSKGFVATLYMRASSSTPAAAFSPALPSSFNSGTQVNSQNSSLTNGFYCSKISEPEAVPLDNFFPVGASNKQILRIVALRDSVIIIKQDGLFKMTGDTINNFAITILDGTVHCVAANSVDVLNNQVCLLSNQGVCLVTESSVQIISRPIEDKIQPILGQSGLAAQTCGLAYETERMYLLTTTEPSTTTASITYAYDILTGSWTSWDPVFNQAVIGPNDVMYCITSDNVINKERKKETRIDFAGQNYSCTVTSISSDGLTAVLNITGHIPVEGDILVKNTVITWVTAAVYLSGTSYTLTLYKSTNLAAADSVILYAKYTKTIKLAPFHAGLVGRLKIFHQMSVHLKDNNLSKAYIYFTNAYFGGSEITTWSFAIAATSGWGSDPWGFFPWGNEAGIDILVGTQPAPILRTWVPKFAARSTYIQPHFEMRNAADMLNIQALSFVLRTYGERVSR